MLTPLDVLLFPVRFPLHEPGCPKKPAAGIRYPPGLVYPRACRKETTYRSTRSRPLHPGMICCPENGSPLLFEGEDTYSPGTHAGCIAMKTLLSGECAIAHEITVRPLPLTLGRPPGRAYQGLNAGEGSPRAVCQLYPASLETVVFFHRSEPVGSEKRLQDEYRGEDHRYDCHQLQEDVEGRARGVLERVPDGIAGDRSLVSG